jgi:diguanylate cyclase (GGDEF)-like protein
MMTVLEREMQRAQRKGSPLSLVIMDIDHFKRVNDTFGHQQGDVVLIAIAALAKQDLRSYDVAARYGGEEFVLILPETTHDEALLVAERIRINIQQQSFAPPLEATHITISMGVATYPRPNISSIDDLIHAADDALYRAKETGRNQVVSSQALPPR